MVEFVAHLTMITPAQMNDIAGDAKKFWIPFEEKIMRFMDLIQVAHIFKKYSNYILKKYVKNGYDRI